MVTAPEPEKALERLHPLLVPEKEADPDSVVVVWAASDKTPIRHPSSIRCIATDSRRGLKDTELILKPIRVNP
jgi:hypothetical protein